MSGNNTGRPSIEERVASLEVRMETVENRNDDYFEKNDINITKINENLSKILKKLDGQRSFLAGIIFALSSIFWFVKEVLTYFGKWPPN